MSQIRSEKVDVNLTLLYESPLKTASLDVEEQIAYSLPQNDEDTGEGSHSALHLEQGESSDEISSGASSAVTDSPGFSPNVLPPGYGAAIVAAFLAMIEYLNQMSQQSYQATVITAQAMIGGPNGAPGLIQGWVNEGIEAAEQSGKQLMSQAMGALIGAAVSGASVGLSVGGFVRNCTDGFGLNDRSQLSKQLENATNYKTMLNSASNPEFEAARAEEITPSQTDGTAAQKEQVQIDNKTAQRKQELIDGVGIDRYQGADKEGRFTEEDQQTRLAAKQMTADERAEAIKKADKRIENLENQRNSYDTKQNSWQQFLNSISQAGTNAGQGYGGMAASDAQVKSGIAKAQADAMQQAGQTTEKVKEDSTSKAQSSHDQMGQMAQAMAQALQAQVQSRA